MKILIFLLERYSTCYTNTEALVVYRLETGLEVNADRTKYMVVSREQHAVQNYYIHIGNKPFTSIEPFRCLGTTLTNRNSIHEEFKGRPKSRKACYHPL